MQLENHCFYSSNDKLFLRFFKQVCIANFATSLEHIKGVKR